MGWRGKALLNGFGALLTGLATVVATVEKFQEGVWLTLVALPLLVVAFETMHRAYTRIGERLGLGRIPEPPHRERSLVIVPVSSLSRLTSEASGAAWGVRSPRTSVAWPSPTRARASPC